MQISLFLSSLFALTFAAPAPGGNFGPANEQGYGRWSNGWSSYDNTQLSLDRGFAVNAARGEEVFKAINTGNCEWCQKKKN
jgi:hypothetical protein